MPPVHRLIDKTKGHGCWPPTTPAEGSPNVYANGSPVIRAGDSITPHTCPTIPETHAGKYAAGHNVHVNGRSIIVVGDSVDCGDHAGTGSGDVYACSG